MLTTEGANKLELLELVSVPINKSCPLIHLVSCLFVELILEIIILLFELLRKLPNDIVFELQEFPLLLVVVHKNSTLSKFSRKIVGKNIDFNFEMLCASILNVVIELSILVQELE